MSKNSQRPATGIALILSSSASNQSGSAIGALAFPVIGSVGVVAVRQIVTAAILTPIVRPSIRGLDRGQWLTVIGLAIVFSVLNICSFAALDRIGLGLAVTIEFLGPLTIAVASSRRILDLACVLGAAVGILMLTNASPSTDVVGIALALAAAASWASYIILNRTAGRRLPGLHGTALASAIAGILWIPFAIFWFNANQPTMYALLLAAACGIMSSIIPYVADLLALRRIATHTFGVFTSANPVWAALAGWIILGQDLLVLEWLGIGLIVLSNVIVSSKELRSPPREQNVIAKPKELS